MSRAPNGFGLIEVLVSIVVLSIALFGSLILVQRSAAINVHESVLLSLGNLRTNLMETIQSKSAWQKTTDDSANPSLKCLSGAGPCPAGRVPLRLLDQDGQVMTDPLQQQLGFDRLLNVCKSFPADPKLTDDNCPFRYELSWESICLDTACTHKSPVIYGVLRYRGSSSLGSLNPNFFNFAQMRDAPFGQPSTLMQQTLQKQKACENGDVLSGFDADGNKVCVSRYPCGSLDLVRSIDSAGVIICRDGHTDRRKASNPQLVNWGTGSFGWHCGTGTFDWRCMGHHWKQRCSPGGICKVEFQYGSGKRTLQAVTQCSTFPAKPVTVGANFCTWDN